MRKPEYFILTQLVVDDIAFNDKLLYKNVLGGGVYTVAGARVWSESVGFATGVGKDFETDLKEWFDDNQIDMNGMIVKHDKSSHSYVNYFDDGEREEISMEGTASLDLSQLRASEIPSSYDEYKGMYIFKNLDEEFWDEMITYLNKNKGVSVWEIFADSARFENREKISEILNNVTLFSLNLTEGKNLTNKNDPVEIVEDLNSLGAKNVIFRMGENGCLVSDGTSIWHVPAVTTKVVDVTGGGNSSTGGYLVGFCESDGDAVQAACYANVAASFIIEQYGPPSKFDEELYKERERRFSELIKEVKKIG